MSNHDTTERQSFIADDAYSIGEHLHEIYDGTAPKKVLEMLERQGITVERKKDKMVLNIPIGRAP